MTQIKKPEIGGQPSTQSYAEPGRSGKIRRLEVEKVEERDGWMNRMIPAGLDGKKQRAEGRGQRTEEREKDEHRTSNIERPTSNEKQKK